MKLVITSTKLEQRYRRLLRMVEALRDPVVMMAVAATKEELAAGRLEEAAQAYAEIDAPTLRALWIAPSKGGIWTMTERRLMQQDQQWLALVHHYRGSDWYTDNAI